LPPITVNEQTAAAAAAPSGRPSIKTVSHDQRLFRNFSPFPLALTREKPALPSRQCAAARERRARDEPDGRAGGLRDNNERLATFSGHCRRCITSP